MNNNWNNIILRMQKASREYTGVVLMQIRVVVKDGNPFFWVPPDITPIEPRAEVGISDLLGHLSEEQMEYLLQKIYEN